MIIAIEKLKEAEVVQMNKIRRMKDGKPKWRAEHELDDLRTALRILQQVNDGKAQIVGIGQTIY